MTDRSTDRLIHQAVTLARWSVWCWLVVTTFVQRRDLDHPVIAVLAIATAFGWATFCTIVLQRRPAILLRPLLIVVEIVLGWGLLVVDGWVFGPGHSFAPGQNLAGQWPLVAIVTAAIALGPWWGALLGALMTSGRFVGGLANGIASWPQERILSLAASAVFYMIAAAVFGAMTRRLRSAENEVSLSRARDEVARTLHDGVLQTLALVDRRVHGSDPELAAVARASDRELRAWLFHGVRPSDEGGTLEERLRRVADRVARNFDQSITVSVVDDPDGRQPSDAICAALSAAAGEAMTNAAKHAEATKTTVYAEIDDDGQAFVSVRDDGRGFDTTQATTRRGIEHSIRRRLQEVGAVADIISTPGNGTEVRLWSHDPKTQ